MVTISQRCRRSAAQFPPSCLVLVQMENVVWWCRKFQIQLADGSILEQCSLLLRLTWCPKGLFHSRRCDMASVKFQAVRDFASWSEFEHQRIRLCKDLWCCQSRCVSTARAQLSLQEFRWPTHALPFSRILHTRKICCLDSAVCSTRPPSHCQQEWLFKIPRIRQLIRNVVCAVQFATESASD